MRSFLGMCNYYQKFIPDCAKTSYPLNLLTRENVYFDWHAEHQAAFESLISALSTAPVLSHPDFTRLFKVETDASDFGL